VEALGRGLVSDELGVPEDGLEEVGEVVGHAHGELTEGGELLGPGQLLLPPSLLGDVADHQEETDLVAAAPRDGRASSRQVLHRAVAFLLKTQYHRPAGPWGCQHRLELDHDRRRHRVTKKLAARLVGTPAEQTLRRGIPRHDAAHRVDRHDGLSGGLDQVLEERLGLRQLAVEVRVPHDERDGFREHPEQVPLARIELARGLDDERAELPSLGDQGERRPSWRVRGRRRLGVEEHLDPLVPGTLLELLGDRGERPVERGVDEHRGGDLSAGSRPGGRGATAPRPGARRR
jgi:hypothetical protein